MLRGWKRYRLFTAVGVPPEAPVFVSRSVTLARAEQRSERLHTVKAAALLALEFSARHVATFRRRIELALKARLPLNEFIIEGERGANADPQSEQANQFTPRRRQYVHIVVVATTSLHERRYTLLLLLRRCSRSAPEALLYGAVSWC